MNNVVSKIFFGLKQRSIQTILTVGMYVLFASSLPFIAHQSFYTVSLFIKDVLIWVMPLTVGFFIAHTVSSFERRAPLFILVLLLFEACSNLSSVWYAYASANVASVYLPSFEMATVKSDFNVLWRLPWTQPSWWSSEKGGLVGLLLGCMAAFSKETFLNRTINQGKEIVEWLLTKVFARLIPLFILGFVARMYQTKLLDQVFTHYTILVIWLIFFWALYLVLLFALGVVGSPLSKGQILSRIVSNIKNLLPAGGIALTSGCSLSTMPWTIVGAAKNLQNPHLAKAIIPATTNIQQIGDCIANTFLCFLLYTQFYGQNPDLVTWISFSIVFVLARFATAAVLGGAIFVMLPIYETYLNFNAEMIAIILALNVVLDPLITSCNVLANGALCRVFERVWAYLHALFGDPYKESFELGSLEK